MKHKTKCPSCKKEFEVEELSPIKCPSCKKEAYWVDYEGDKFSSPTWFTISWELPETKKGGKKK